MGVLMFLLYRLIFLEIGAEQFGVWSLVLASTNLTQIATLGLSGSVVKFVARYLALNEEQTAIRVLETSLIFSAGAVAVLLIIMFLAAEWLLPLITDGSMSEYALSILPFAVVSIWLIALLSIYYGGLEGCQRINVRSGLMVFGSFLYAGLCVLFLKGLNGGLIGLAYANVLQYFILVVISLFALRRYIKVSIIPYRWSGRLFHEMIGYGINFQVSNVFAALIDPLTKTLLSVFGGVALVGYYTLAYNVVAQFRSLIVTANRVLIPVFAGLTEKSPSGAVQLYISSLRVAFFVSIPVYTIILMMAPLLSVFLVGGVASGFIASIWCIGIGSLVSTVSAPAYIAYLGNGELKWNTVSEIASVIIIGAVGSLLGGIMGGNGVLIGWAVGRSMAILIVPAAYHHRFAIPQFVLWTQENIGLTLACLFSLIIGYWMFFRFDATVSVLWQTTITLFCFLLVLVVPVWKHSMRRKLQNWVQNTLVPASHQSP